MTNEEYDNLYQKYNSGKCTEEECRLVELHAETLKLSDLPWNEATMGNAEKVKQQISENLAKSIATSERRKILNPRIWFVAASVVLVAFSALIYSRNYVIPPEVVTSQKTTINEEDILPGEDKAMLTLDDGSRINLDDAANGMIAKESNTTIKKLPNGQLEYIAGAAKTGNGIKYNTITTPRGGKYQISLPDGSRVWLNAGSSLRFPTVFSGAERKVELTGEAYFEVAKNSSMPFKVLSGDSEIRVLGTHFNVMAYSDEKQMNTTLLEGSVQVVKGANKVMIKPGQSAVFNKATERISVSPADIDQAIAWKNGYFIFVDESIESIMRKVSRWYDVEVTYKGDMANKDFNGTISRSKNVSEVLRMLELTGAIHFKIGQDESSGKGRRITVMP